MAEAVVAVEAAATAHDSQGTELQKPEAESAEPKPGQEVAVPQAQELCCICKRPVDEENSVVLVRQSSKGGTNTRRCRSCQSVRHSKLVESFNQNPNSDKDKATAFYTQWPHLRGSALQKGLQAPGPAAELGDKPEAPKLKMARSGSSTRSWRLWETSGSGAWTTLRSPPRHGASLRAHCHQGQGGSDRGF